MYTKGVTLTYHWSKTKIDFYFFVYICFENVQLVQWTNLLFFYWGICTFVSLGSLDGIFSQILGEDETVREKAIKFLGAKIKTLPEDTLDSHSEELLINMCKKVSARKGEILDSKI